MKILHLSPSFFPASYYGGPIRSGFALCTELAKLGCEVRVLTTNSNGPRVVPTPPGQEVALNGFHVMYCGRLMQPDIAPSLLWHLPEYLRWADVVHIVGVFSYTTLPGLAGAAVWRKPVVWTPRGSLQGYGLCRSRYLKRAWLTVCHGVMPARVALHVTSDEERADSAAVMPQVPASVIANGVDIPESVVRTNSSGDPRLLFVGRLHPVKGLENLLAACSLVPNVMLTIAGDGDREYAASLHRLVDRLGLEERVTFVGEVLGSVKKRLFESSDVLVLPSHTENFGMAIAEALSYGVPVIAALGTPWRRVEEIGCGLWTANTPESLAGAIDRIRGMPLREMGARGRAWIQAEYTWQPRAQAMLALYRELLSPSWQPDAPQRSAA